MYLFYNKSDKIIQGFGAVSFKDNGLAGFDSDLHTEYEGDFEIPETRGNFRSQSFTATEGQKEFTLTYFEYDTDKHNITVIVNDKLLFEDEYEETSSTKITLNNGLTEGDIVILESYEIYDYQFDEDTNTFSKITN